MAELLVNQFFQPDFIDDLADKIHGIHRPFDQDDFKVLIYSNEWEQKTLKERMSHIAACMNQLLPVDFEESTTILNKVVDRYQGFDGMIFPDFVRQFGVDHWNTSLNALELYTRYSSSEFAIRVFILKNADLAMQKMLEWSNHENHHVRRLASEGCRPRLPWAMALPAFKKNPSLILPILENLKSDSSEYVCKSVANNLNDITKDNPEVAISLAKQWLKKGSKETQWIVKHGFRGLIKAGNPRALELLGYKKAEIEVKNLSVTPEKLELGGELSLYFEIKNKEEVPAKLVVDYAIHFVKSNGKTSPKVFKLANLDLAPYEQKNLEKRHPIKPITTRKYYPGITTIQILVNGQPTEEISFELII